MPLGCLILAAGEGKRMKSALAKPLHRVAGKTMIAHVLAYVRPLGPAPICVVLGVGREMMAEALAGEDVALAVQHEQLGTGHAVMAAAEVFADFEGDLLITCADIPLVRPETLQALLDEHHARGAAGTVLTALYDDPTGYGRVVRDGQGLVTGIVEHKDASPEVRAIREINAGVYVFQARALFEALGRVRPDNAQGEYYLPDVLADFVASGRAVAAVPADDPQEVMGINNRLQLAEAEAKARQRTNEALMLAGATLIDPAHTYVEAGVTVGPDTVIWPGVVLSGATTIGANCTIGPNVQITDCVVGDNCTIRQGTVMAGSALGQAVQAGPYSHVRPGCQIDDDARIGTYTELVRTHVGPRVKSLHFSYLGDAEVGAGANIGAGAVTCNYDGQAKHRTIIGAGAFIGSDSILVAPVEIGAGAYTAAGSVITKDVPPDSLGIGRSRQETHEGWVSRKRAQQQSGA